MRDRTLHPSKQSVNRIKELEGAESSNFSSLSGFLLFYLVLKKESLSHFWEMPKKQGGQTRKERVGKKRSYINPIQTIRKALMCESEGNWIPLILNKKLESRFCIFESNFSFAAPLQVIISTKCSLIEIAFHCYFTHTHLIWSSFNRA